MRTTARYPVRRGPPDTPGCLAPTGGTNGRGAMGGATEVPPSPHQLSSRHVCSVVPLGSRGACARRLRRAYAAEAARYVGAEGRRAQDTDRPTAKGASVRRRESSRRNRRSWPAPPGVGRGWKRGWCVSPPSFLEPGRVSSAAVTVVPHEDSLAPSAHVHRCGRTHRGVHAHRLRSGQRVGREAVVLRPIPARCSPAPRASACRRRGVGHIATRSVALHACLRRVRRLVPGPRRPLAGRGVVAGHAHALPHPVPGEMGRRTVE